MRTNILPPLRIIQGLFALIILGLDAYRKPGHLPSSFPLSHIHLHQNHLNPHPTLSPSWPPSPPPHLPIQNTNNSPATAWFNSTIYPVPSEIAFVIFAAVFTLLVHLPYCTLCPTYFPALASGYASLAFEALTTIFWFAGFIAQAVFLNELAVCRGSVCGSARAATGFAGVLFGVFVVTLYFPVFYCFFAEREADADEEAGHRGVGGGKRDGFKMGVRKGKTKGHVRMHSNWLGQRKDETNV